MRKGLVVRTPSDHTFRVEWKEEQQLYFNDPLEFAIEERGTGGADVDRIEVFHMTFEELFMLREVINQVLEEIK